MWFILGLMGQSTLHWIIGIVVLLIISLIFVVIFGIDIGGIRLSILEYLTAADVLIGGLLTGALVFLYYQQKNILEEQKKLKTAELSGDLRVESIETDDNQLNLNLSNMSGSEVSEIELYTEIFPKAVNGAIFSVWGEPLKRKDRTGGGLRRSNAMAPHEQEIQFTVQPHVGEKDQGGREMKHQLHFAIHRLRDKYGLDEIDLRMWVEGVDQVGNSLRDKVLRMDRHLDFTRLSDEPGMREILKISGAANIDEDESEYDGRLSHLP